VDVVAPDNEVISVTNAVVCKAALPDWEFGREAVGEASLDESDGSFEGDHLWGEEEMDVVGHDDEGVEFIAAFGSVVLECFDEEFGVGGDLKEAAAVVGSAGDEEGSGTGCAGGDRHRAIVVLFVLFGEAVWNCGGVGDRLRRLELRVPQGLKPVCCLMVLARLKPCP
jgi:hypothetical protein